MWRKCMFVVNLKLSKTLPHGPFVDQSLAIVSSTLDNMGTKLGKVKGLM
ncbi:putative C6 transcription factor [Corchorus olitorius]|uniref:C6 transcription factor n=1 Tax=Corchorus olitorius TaxID=93759 RepID=A0A1R3JRZ4_9ROSI|nr:putative C6 transcription factor [Corchorus olitorius]